MDFDDKTEEQLTESDLFKKEVFLAVKEYVGAHPETWTASMMREDISQEKDWENDFLLSNLVKASLLKLGFAALGATGGKMKISCQINCGSDHTVLAIDAAF